MTTRITIETGVRAVTVRAHIGDEAVTTYTVRPQRSMQVTLPDGAVLDVRAVPVEPAQ